MAAIPTFHQSGAPVSRSSSATARRPAALACSQSCRNLCSSARLNQDSESQGSRSAARVSSAPASSYRPSPISVNARSVACRQEADGRCRTFPKILTIPACPDWTPSSSALLSHPTMPGRTPAHYPWVTQLRPGSDRPARGGVPAPAPPVAGGPRRCRARAALQHAPDMRGPPRPVDRGAAAVPPDPRDPTEHLRVTIRRRSPTGRCPARSDPARARPRRPGSGRSGPSPWSAGRSGRRPARSSA